MTMTQQTRLAQKLERGLVRHLQERRNVVGHANSIERFPTTLKSLDVHIVRLIKKKPLSTIPYSQRSTADVASRQGFRTHRTQL